MKYRESCSCGASVEIEDTTAGVVVQRIADWRARHKHTQHPPTVGPTSPTWPHPGQWQPQPYIASHSHMGDGQ